VVFNLNKINKMADLIATQIYKTKDYDKFIIDVNLNRNVNIPNVKKIKNSIKDYGDHGVVFPIVVDDKMRIIDGQHRFTARKELGLTIYYIQDLELDINKLGGINDAVKKWIGDDYEKVNSNSTFYKLLKDCKNSIDFNNRLVDVPVRAFSKTLLGISDKLFLEASQDYVNDINVKFNLLKPYIKWSVEKCYNFAFGGRTYESPIGKFRYLAPIAKKLLKNKVDLKVLKDNYNSLDEFTLDMYNKGFTK
jgi:hypothetical protein